MQPEGEQKAVITTCSSTA